MADERYVYLVRVFNKFLLFNDAAPTEIYTLSLHDALPIFAGNAGAKSDWVDRRRFDLGITGRECFSRFAGLDRKSTRLNSSHSSISYAVFCLKKKTRLPNPHRPFRPC